MTLLSRISAIGIGLISAVTLLGNSAEAIHPQIQRQYPSESAVEKLIAVADSYGVPTFTEQNNEWTAEQCKKGMFGIAVNLDNGRRFVSICVNNHKGDWEELTDTLRHEMTHVAQYCNGGPLDPMNSANYMNATRNIGWDIMGTYPAKVWAVEAEAFYAAHYMSETQVANLLHRFCG